MLRESDTGKESDAKSYTQAGKYESYLMLGFTKWIHQKEAALGRPEIAETTGTLAPGVGAPAFMRGKELIALR